MEIEIRNVLVVDIKTKNVLARKADMFWIVIVVVGLILGVVISLAVQLKKANTSIKLLTLVVAKNYEATAKSVDNMNKIVEIMDKQENNFSRLIKIIPPAK